MNNVSLIDGHIDEVKQTNYDRIRNMSVEELAEFLGYSIYAPTSNARVVRINGQWFYKYEIKQWLESEVTE